jgi:hypothetical protein
MFYFQFSNNLSNSKQLIKILINLYLKFCFEVLFLICIGEKLLIIILSKISIGIIDTDKKYLILKD